MEVFTLCNCDNITNSYLTQYEQNGIMKKHLVTFTISTAPNLYPFPSKSKRYQNNKLTERIIF